MGDALGLSIGSPYDSTLALAVISFTMDQTTDELAFIFQVPPAWSGAITRVWIRQGTLTGVAPVFRVSLQGVDGSGHRDGTIKTSSTVFVDYTPTAGNNNTGQWVTLGTSYTPSSGEWLAVVVKNQSGTIDASNKCTFGQNAQRTGVFMPGYSETNDGGAGFVRSVSIPVFGYGTATRAFGWPSLTYSNTPVASAGAEMAVRFIIPSTWCSSYTVAGIRFIPAAWTAATTLRMQLYTGTTVLQTVDHDSDQQGGSSSGIQLLFSDASLTALTPGSAYYVGVQNLSTPTLNWSYLDVSANADMDAFVCGKEWYAATRSGGAWTDTSTRRFFVSLILSGLTGGSGGGLLRPSSMAGGF